MTNLTAVLNPFHDLDSSHHDLQGPSYVVIHPLYDAPEEKRRGEHLGPLKLSLGSRLALGALRVYLIGMLLLATYRVMDFAGVFKHVH